MSIPIQIPNGFEHLEDSLSAFFEDNPHFDSNIFLMMRFNESTQFNEIVSSLKTGLNKYGLRVLRADERAYHDSLMENVFTYLIGCKYGIVVFEEIEERSFNPNVALELGYMLALNRRVLILKDSRMPKLPTDIVGRIYKTFDIFTIRDSILKQVDQWIVDLGILGQRINWLFDKCETEIEILDSNGEKAHCKHRFVGKPATKGINSYKWILSADGTISDTKASSNVQFQLAELPKYRGRSVFEQNLDIRDPEQTIEFTLEYTMHDSFLKEDEYWGAKVREPTNSLSISVKFPKGRPCNNFTARSELENEIVREEDQQPNYDPRKRILSWQTDNPVYLRSYILDWNW